MTYYWESVNPPIYKGKSTCCHSQALLTAFLTEKNNIDLMMFENLTTIPFGIKHVPNDPNRLLDSYLDPDIGLDRALKAINFSYELKYWEKGSDGSEAILLLKDWLSTGPVILGPLDMGGLPYFFHKEVFQSMDHYIVALALEKERVHICDPEGFILAFSTVEDLLRSWRGQQIPEGRGEFSMRRILDSSNFTFNQDTLIQTLRLAIDNLLNARIMNNCGGKALRFLADQEPALSSNISLKRGLTFVIPTRIQRNIFIQQYIRTIQLEPFSKGYLNILSEILNLLSYQITIYSRILADFMDRTSEDLKKLELCATSEEKLTDLFLEIGEKI